jgi:hypothetical protein
MVIPSLSTASRSIRSWTFFDVGDRHVSKCRRVEYGKTPIVSVDFEHCYRPRAYATARLDLLAFYQSPCVAIPFFLGGEDVNLLTFYPLVAIPFFLGQDISECSMYDCRFSVFRFFHSFFPLFSFYLDFYLYKEEGGLIMGTPTHRYGLKESVPDFDDLSY